MTLPVVVVVCLIVEALAAVSFGVWVAELSAEWAVVFGS